MTSFEKGAPGRTNFRVFLLPGVRSTTPKTEADKFFVRQRPFFPNDTHTTDSPRKGYSENHEAGTDKFFARGFIFRLKRRP